MARWKRRVRVCIITLVALLVLLCGAFAFNGLVLAHGNDIVFAELPDSLQPTSPRKAADGDEQPLVKVLAFNIAKCFVHNGGLSFEDKDAVLRRTAIIGELIRRESPDLVFLEEMVIECGPCEVDQVAEIARECGMPHRAFGENYNVGFPGYRIVGGNAILSRWPLEPIENIDLPGRKPFYVTKNNRRALWCATDIAGQRVLLCAIHTDSFDLQNNLVQTKAIFDYAAGRPVMLAGDFNAQPHEPPMQFLKDTGRFVGEWGGPVTFPGKRETIDYILAPAGWEVVEHRVIDSDVSDHFPIVTTFRVSGGK